MKCLKPITVNGNVFNCGQCHNCRINYTSQWALRLLYELSEWNNAAFITLTYDNEHLPKDNGLNPEDLKLFWKRLRKKLNGRKIKYYACGEYGDSQKIYWSPGAKQPHGRPHFHAIVFGLNPYSDNHVDDDRQLLRECWNKCEPWFFDKSRGRASGMQEVNRYDIAYVTGYVQKKLTGELGSETYGICQRPFCRSSHFMGLNFALDNAERLRNNGFTYLGKRRIGLPRYFRDKLEIEQKEFLDNHGATENWKKENEILFKDFQAKTGVVLNDSNLTQISRRFERWLDDMEWTFSNQIERDYLQEKHLRGIL